MKRRTSLAGYRLKTRREIAEMVLPGAREALLDAATEVAAILGGTPDPSHELGAELAAALGRLYAANDVWQEAQVAASL